MKTVKFAIAFGLATGIAVALAAEQTVSQKGRRFSMSEATLKKGDVLVFQNDDNVAHNILSTTPGNEFNLHSQPPGASTPVTFDKTGDIKIVCAIHPTMQMMVKVSD